MTVLNLGKICLIAWLLFSSTNVEQSIDLSPTMAVIGFQSALWVAKDLKIFDKHGLDVEVIMITGSASSIRRTDRQQHAISTGSATGPLAAAVKEPASKVIAVS